MNQVTPSNSSNRFVVVTPNYNMAEYLETTIQSVLGNLREGDEYFVIDGGSSDSSINIIKKYANRLTGWVSESDSGYAHAISKGFSLGNAQYQCWINCGDLLLEGALDKARAALDATGADLIFGDDLLIDDAGKVLQVTNGHAADLRAMMLYAGWTPLQESCFWTRDVYERVGGIDPAVKYAADYDFFLRISLAGRCQYLPAVFGAFRRHEGQLSMAKTALYKAERERCRARELAALPRNPWLPLISSFFWLKVRWRVRMLAKKRNMSHLEGKPVMAVPSQDTRNAEGATHGA
jgi:glycosyltransferase involved in cell wall biosynthesis